MQAQFDLDGKTALVTGASRGIGLALARALGRAGARIVLNGRSGEALSAAAAALEGEGIASTTAIFDVADRDAVRASTAAIEAERAIDILVNCAGIQARAPLEEFAPATWDALFRTNVDGVFQVSQAVAPGMIARGRGKIVNVCSVQSMLGRPSIAPYAATKGAVAMLTKGMCADWGPRGLQVNGLAPGYFATELTQPLVDDPEFTAWLARRTPAGRWGRVEELGGACVFLASAAANFVNGQILYVDGGMTSVV